METEARLVRATIIVCLKNIMEHLKKVKVGERFGLTHSSSTRSAGSGWRDPNIYMRYLWRR